MDSFLPWFVWLIIGILIGWITEYFLMRNQFGSEADALRTQVGSYQSENNQLKTQLDQATGAAATAEGALSTRDERIAALEKSLAECNEKSAETDRLRTELEEARTELAHANAQVANAAADTDGDGIADSVVPDNLRRIEGIGPKMQSVLNDIGIHTFAQLAAAKAEDIRAKLTEAGVSGINDPTTWPEQAALAAAGDWDALEKLQDELDGGRRV